MLDLNPEDLMLIRKILAEHVPHEIVWAYGSRVDGGAHEGSDLDLVIIHPQDASIPQQNLAILREAFSASQLPILVDVLDWARIPDSFRQEIKQRYEVIQPV
ncbi:MAG: nucleotidyltransferase domain-containing protein [Gammaproteobacteria bacterium]|nr:MAG: nucleotidyltransferase domain-containing protein [Gammaproteobacteria bacterium]